MRRKQFPESGTSPPAVSRTTEAAQRRDTGSWKLLSGCPLERDAPLGCLHGPTTTTSVTVRRREFCFEINVTTFAGMTSRAAAGLTSV